MLGNLEELLDKQVIHMDQGACYCPEYRATRLMRHYPSRKLQFARSVLTGELSASEGIASMLFQSILSGQGERWQNFDESPDELLSAMLRARKMMVSKGNGSEVVDALKGRLEHHGGHLYPVDETVEQLWPRHIPTSPESKTALMLDDATVELTDGAAREFGDFFESRGERFHPDFVRRFPGWELFAHGLIDEGTAHLEGIIRELEAKGVKTLVTLTGQTQYLFARMPRMLGIEHRLRVVNVLELIERLRVDRPVYLYAGSFYARYLQMSERLNELVPNSQERLIRNSPERVPLLDGDRRVNRVTIWQKPAVAEYVLFGMDEDITARILEEAVQDIRKAHQSQTVVFDPHAYHALRRTMTDEEVLYFSQLL